MNKTSTLYREKVGQMKLILRFSLINPFRDFCSDAKSEYIEPTGN